MNTLVHSAHLLSPAVAGVLVTSVWQGLLLVVGVALALRMLRSVPPATRTIIWSFVLLLMVALPVLSAVLPHRVQGGVAGLHVAENWSAVLLSLWAVFSLARGVRLGASAVRLWRLAGRATPVAVDGEITALLEGSRQAQVCVTAEVNRPSVTGFFRPRILLPIGLMESLSAAELAHVVLHEMEHLRRHDDWVNLAQQISLVLLPLNPALFWLDRQLCRDRELACDDGVLEATQARKAYAACLVKLAEDSLLRKGVALALSALGTRARESELLGRVRRILSGPERVGTARDGRIAVAALSIGIFVGVGTLVRSPELVRFDLTPEVMAQVEVSSPNQVVPMAHAAEPALARMPTAELRPVLTKAVFEPPVMHRAAAAVMRKKYRVRAVRVRAAIEPTPWKMLPATEGRVVPTHHVVRAEFEVPQAVYAAVPFEDGWLIVQL